MNQRILVIEDDSDIALGIVIVLGKSGFDVTTATDERTGLRMFHRARPDLVILDIGLPGLDGWTVLERVRDLSDVPILVLTAHGQESDKVRALDGGADDYLTKPFGNAELAARARALLRRRPAPTEYRLLAALVRHRARSSPSASCSNSPGATRPPSAPNA